MENKIYKLSDDEFINLIKSSLNISEVLFKLGYTTKGNSWGYSQVKRRMTDLGLGGEDFRGKSAIKLLKSPSIDKEKVLCEHSKHTRQVARRLIIKENLIPYKCAICGIDQWNGKTLSLELDHINGINTDNRLENLRFLCPNCHSQTSTYGSKNIKLREIQYDISDEVRDQIINKYMEIKNSVQVAKELGYSRNAVKQVLKDAKLGKSNQKYVIQYDKNHNEIRRFGCINECCKWLIENNLVKTKLIKTCRATLNKNANSLWHDYYFEILDV